MVNEVGEGIVSNHFCRYAGNKANSVTKELNNANINTKGAAPNHKMGLPLNSLFL